MLILFTPEALYSMWAHSGLLCSLWWHHLDVANHCCIAAWVKFVIICWLDALKIVIYVICWIFRELWLDSVFEVSQKPHSIVKFHLEGLVINRGPQTFNCLLSTLSPILAKSSFSLILIHYVKFPDVWFLKPPFMLVTNNLDFIR